MRFLTLLVTVLLAAQTAFAEKLSVVTTNYPLTYFTERIAGDFVDISFPAKDAADPSLWKPTPEDIVKMQEADVIFINGATYEKWLSKVSIPNKKLINTSLKFSDRYIHIHEHVTHTHGPGGEHTHHGVASTTWLNFELAVLQAKAIAFTLKRKLPEKEKDIFKNFDELKTDLMKLHQQMADAAKLIGDKPLLASHPVYQYLAKGYGLKIKSLHWEPGLMPNDSEWNKLKAKLKKHPAKFMLWEGAPHPDVEQKLKKMKIHTILFSPLGSSQGAEFTTEMSANLKRLSNEVS